jgi:hypothetical protein
VKLHEGSSQVGVRKHLDGYLFPFGTPERGFALKDLNTEGLLISMEHLPKYAAKLFIWTDGRDVRRQHVVRDRSDCTLTTWYEYIPRVGFST